MAGVWKRDGTVAVTNGNKKVTGTGTTFADTKNGVAKGHLFCITSGTSVDFYEVDYVVSNTELYLVQAYRGVTATGKAYEIITTFSDSVPEFARRLTATLSAYQQQSDAFQALLTSTATTVEVTAPDGTKQTLIPWKRVTSEGEGQAARAKTEADKAAASAALAGDIVVASALPLPDVWAPLSDSLRLITGYGRDVLVGSDVVARMVNFSRSTTASYKGKDGQQKSAAVNEPRFEREGLLNELQSTNLIQTPGTLTTQTIQVSAGTHTLSFFGVGSVTLSGAATGTLVGVGASDRVAMTFTATAGALTLTVAGVCSNGQIEALPFATSYMQPSGAAVTRAPDAAYLQAAGNRFAFQGFTVAFEWDLLGVSDRIADNRLLDLDNDASSNRHYVGVSQERRLVAMFGTNKIVSQSAVMSGLCVLVVNGPSFSLYNNGSKIGTATVTGRAEAANARLYLLCNNTGLFQSAGHMRNLRIWHRALSEAQIKAIA
ncbi:LamG-like jellyroll fold domain-containing protein [Aeromonas caviae]|uniref:LamG-like jellyroll fold domain-containing protein n=1 Tax=Aeromonas caviae TaxID=648 RepID=UPI002442374C|nr:LamG-like jellyroll fold domain-containing protein [Aeromonas caviae]